MAVVKRGQYTHHGYNLRLLTDLADRAGPPHLQDKCLSTQETLRRLTRPAGSTMMLQQQQPATDCTKTLHDP